MSTSAPVNRMVVKPGQNRRNPGEPLLVAFPGLPTHRRRFLRPEGESVPLDPYWRRRLRSGDAVPVEPKGKAG